MSSGNLCAGESNKQRHHYLTGAVISTTDQEQDWGEASEALSWDAKCKEVRGGKKKEKKTAKRKRNLKAKFLN